MAVRPPRRTRDEQSNVTPLHGEKPRAQPGQSPPGTTRRFGPGGSASGIDPETGVWTPTNPTQREPWRKGYDPRRGDQTTHGLTKEDTIRERAEQFLAAALGDPAVPDHVRAPSFAAAAQAWARAETMEEMAFDWVSRIGIEAALTQSDRSGAAPVDLWFKARDRAERARMRLGLDPASYAKIRKDLGLEQKASEMALETLAAAGAQITARREIEA